MPGTTAYASVSELKTYLRIVDTIDDTAVIVAANSASRLIDAFCGRAFDLDATASVARVYSWTRAAWYGAPDTVLSVDDIGSTTGLVIKTDDNSGGVYETTWAATDYVLEPANAAADAMPWTSIRAIASRRFPTTDRGIQVTARWGYPSTPDPVKQATLLQASRLFSRRGAPFGIAGSPDMGSEMRLLSMLDPDVQVLLRPYRRMWAVA